MGMPKHGKESARTKKCKKYSAEGRYFTNKEKKARRHEKLMERFRLRREKKAGGNPNE